MRSNRLSLWAIPFAMTVIGYAACAVAAPRMVLSEDEFEFGFVPQNSRISHVFRLYSKGDDTLRIIQVVAGCSCTQVPLKKQELAVGDSTELEIIFDTRSYLGGVNKSPLIATNEGKPDRLVRFHADVVARPDSTYPIVIRPYKLDLMQVGDKPRSEIKFAITNVSNKLLELKLAAAPDDLVDIALPGSIPAGKTADGVLTLKKSALNEEFEKSLTIQVNDDNASRFTVPVKRSIRGATAQTISAPPAQAH